MLYSDLLKRYERKRLRNASPRTIVLHQIALGHFERFLKRPATTDDLTDDVVEDFIFWRREESVTAATINRDLYCILALWRFANRHRIVNTWPEVELEREPQRTPVAWTAAELSTLVATTKDLQGPVRFNDTSLPTINRCDWWTALILTAFDSGERITALLGVEWSDVDLDAGWILFRAEHRKGGRADNCLDVADDTIEALRRIKRPSGKVFPWDRGDLWMHFGAILEQAGLPYDRKRKFHCIRKSTASHLAAAGGDPGQMLTHSCAKVTQAYLDPRITGQRESIKRLSWRP